MTALKIQRPRTSADRKPLTTAQRLDESRAKKNTTIAALQQQVDFYKSRAEWHCTALAETEDKLDQAERKLAWAYGIMVVGFGLLGGLLLAVLTR